MTPSIDLGPAVSDPFAGIDPAVLTDVGPVVRGKVRDVVDLGDRLALVSTDRLSAFDRVLGTVPYRGQVLNELSAWWFSRLAAVIPSHLISVPDPNVTIGHKCEAIAVEVVVRGHLSGSTSTALWTRYANGERTIYGLRFPDGMTKNDALDRPVLTPTTKESRGGHDRPVSETEVVDGGLVDAERWDQIRETALELFERGRSIAAAVGLVLVDTKYEFGVDRDGRLRLIDEVHTPDSSRYWRADTLESRRRDSAEPDHLDKELVRLAYRAQGFRGDGRPPPLAPSLAERTAAAYLEAFRRLTGSDLVPAPYPAGPRVERIIRGLA